MGKEHLESPAKARSWTKIEDYLRPLQRRSAHRLAKIAARLDVLAGLLIVYLNLD